MLQVVKLKIVLSYSKSRGRLRAKKTQTFNHKSREAPARGPDIDDFPAWWRFQLGNSRWTKDETGRGRSEVAAAAAPFHCCRFTAAMRGGMSTSWIFPALRAWRPCSLTSVCVAHSERRRRWKETRRNTPPVSRDKPILPVEQLK